MTFTIMHLIEILLLLAACYCCWRAGVHQGVMQTIYVLQEAGVLEPEEEGEDNG